MINIRSLDQAIRNLFSLLGRLAPTNKLNSESGLLKYLEFWNFSMESDPTLSEETSSKYERTFMYGVNEGLGPQRYVITYRKTKLAVIESTALLWFIGR